MGIYTEHYINTEQVVHQKHTNNRWKINVKVMGVYKGAKNNQNFGIIPSLSHCLVECNVIQEYAHIKKTKKMDNHLHDQNASIYARTD